MHHIRTVCFNVHSNVCIKVVGLVITCTIYCTFKSDFSSAWIRSCLLRLPAERPYSAMDPNMNIKVALFGETFTTYWTFKWFFSGMDTKMFVTVAACRETLPTLFTAEWSWATMHANMHHKIAPKSETFTTFRTFIGFLPGMDTKMSAKM